jgi:hypothetical protein
VASRPDAAATAQLGEEVVRPRFLCFLDIDGDPLRATTWPVSLSFSGTGDTDLDGYTFDALRPELVEVGPVKHQDGGSETVTVSLSGLILPDNDLLNLMGDPANWRGREARLWAGVADESGVQQGAIWAYHTGTMTDLKILGSARGQVIQVSIETYLAAIAPASNRTYLDQKLFDSGDESAKASIAVANGVSGSTPGVAGDIVGNAGGYGRSAHFLDGIHRVF